MDVGFVGLGAMGQVIVPRLLAAGHRVSGWNRSKDRAAPLVAKGMRLADTPGRALSSLLWRRARLRLRGVDLDSPAGTAESLLGPEAWNLVRADRARPRDHDAPGMALDQIAVVVDAVEAL